MNIFLRKGLLEYATILNLFSSKYKNKKSIITESAKLYLSTSTLKDCTNILCENINKKYQTAFVVNLADILVETQVGLEKKATQVQEKREKRSPAKAFASNMEMSWNEILVTGTILRKMNYASIKII